MPTLTIRNLDEGTKRRLRLAAAISGSSMEREAIKRIAPPLHLKGPRNSILNELEKLAITPDREIDWKRLSDAMWDESN